MNKSTEQKEQEDALRERWLALEKEMQHLKEEAARLNIPDPKKRQNAQRLEIARQKRAAIAAVVKVAEKKYGLLYNTSRATEEIALHDELKHLRLESLSEYVKKVEETLAPSWRKLKKEQDIQIMAQDVYYALMRQGIRFLEYNQAIEEIVAWVREHPEIVPLSPPLVSRLRRENHERRVEKAIAPYIDTRPSSITIRQGVRAAKALIQHALYNSQYEEWYPSDFYEGVSINQIVLLLEDLLKNNPDSPVGLDTSPFQEKYLASHRTDGKTEEKCTI